MNLADENRVRLAVARAVQRDRAATIRLLWELLKDLTPGVRK